MTVTREGAVAALQVTDRLFALGEFIPVTTLIPSVVGKQRKPRLGRTTNGAAPPNSHDSWDVCLSNLNLNSGASKTQGPPFWDPHKRDYNFLGTFWGPLFRTWNPRFSRGLHSDCFGGAGLQILSAPVRLSNPFAPCEPDFAFHDL